MDVRFKTPVNFYVCGQTQAGKSRLTRCMLRHLEELFYPAPTKIIYCYREYQKEFVELPPNVELMEGFSDNLSNMVRGHDHSLIVLDDLMLQCSNDQRVADLFMRGSHHREISVLYLTQNLFPPGKLSRTISVNSHYFVIFRNPRDSLGISTLAKQMFPGRTDYLVEFCPPPKILIETVPEGVITAIYECCLNMLKGVIFLTPCQKRRLVPYKTHCALANRKVS